MESTYNTANQLIGVESTDEAETLLLDYDDNGNLSTSGRFADITDPAAATFNTEDMVRDLTTYTWDAADRLTTYEHDADADTSTVDDLSSYTYNGDGDRLAQSVNGETIQYMLDSQSGLTQVLGEFGPESDTYYLLGMDVLGAETDGTWGYHHGDGLGSLRMVTDNTGSITYSADYDPLYHAASVPKPPHHLPFNHYPI